MADPRNDPIFSTGFNQSLIKQNSSSSNTAVDNGNNNNNGTVRYTLGALLIRRLECMLLLLQVLHNGKM